MPANHSEMKLGKAPAKHDSRTLKLANYLVAENLPPPPHLVAWSGAVKSDPKFSMLLNDQLGCCTIATGAHLIRGWNANAGRDVALADKDVLEAYQRICGYKPDDPETDQGGIELDVLNAFRKDGIGGHKIGAFVAIDPHNQEEVKTAIAIFGGIYTGLALPDSAQNQDVWTPLRGSRGAPGSWGGHAVPFIDYKMVGHQLHLFCVTWGELKAVTWSFFTKYCDEAYAIVTEDWLNEKGQTPTGLDLKALQKDLSLVTKVSGKKAEAPKAKQTPNAERRTPNAE